MASSCAASGAGSGLHESALDFVRADSGECIRGTLTTTQVWSAASSSSSSSGSLTSTPLDVVVLCHGLLGHRNGAFLPQLASELMKQASAGAGSSQCAAAVYRFDFRGCGKSDGTTYISGYPDDMSDLRTVVQGLRAAGHRVFGVVGHSRGANTVMLYASTYKDIASVVAVAPRFHMKHLPDKYYTADQLQQAESSGSFEWRSGDRLLMVVRKEDIAALRAMDMSVVRDIPAANVRTLVCHGTADEVIPVVDAADYVNTAPECKLRLYAGANHSFTNDQAERDRLVQDVTAFVLKSCAAASLPVYPLVRHFDHLYITVSDFERAEAWYTSIFVDLLGCRVGKLAIDGDPHRHFHTPHFNLAIRPARPSKAATASAGGGGGGGVGAAAPSVVFDEYAPGLHHVCLKVPTRHDVDELAAGLQRAGIKHTPPQDYEYADGYYSVFFRDPDGVRFEVMAELPVNPRAGAWSGGDSSGAAAAASGASGGGGGGAGGGAGAKKASL